MFVAVVPSITTFLWVFGLTLIPVLGWAIKLTWMQYCIQNDTKTLLEMHRDPDKFGFGTVRTNRIVNEHNLEFQQCVRQNTAAIRALTHYIRWFAKQQTGQDPPPPMPDENPDDGS